MTEVIKANNPESPERTASILKSEGVVVYPTETLYGLGALVSCERAVERIFEIKGRPHGKPIPILIRDMKMLEGVAEMSASAYSLADKFWPGALTLVLKEKGGLPELITSGTGKVAVRISDNDFVKRLFNLIDTPITSTSANLSGEDNILDLDYIYDTFKDKVDLIVDSGNLPPSKGSTIVDVALTPPVIIREGDVSAREIKEFL